MKIVILNGSPKGDQSVTLQYVLYIQKKFPQHEFIIFNISQKIKILEKNQEKFQEIIEEIKNSNGIIWSTPVYYFCIPSQYKRFIELILESNAAVAFKDKYTVALTTSINFYDHTAHNYLHAICDDLGMKYVGNYSAEMNDLLLPEKRENLILFAEIFFDAIKNNITTSRHFSTLKYREFSYAPGDIKEKIDTKGKKILVITDSVDEQTNLGKMIKIFQAIFSSNIDVINIHDVDIKGGCLGCIQCGYDNQCIYKYKDGFMEFWNEKIIKSDIIIFAGNIKDRYLSSRWKMVFDRSFFNGHVPTLIEKQMGFIISGPLTHISNLRQILLTYVESQGSNCVDIITDEFGDSAQIDALIQNFANQLIRLSNSNYIPPPTFRSIGGKKLFRDAIYGMMRFVFRADDRYYEEVGLYKTFPHNDKTAARMNKTLIPLIDNDEVFRKNFYSRVKEEMVKPLKNIVANK